jgi:hypothetical protein
LLCSSTWPPVCEGDLGLLATAAAVTGASDPLALDSLLLELVLLVDWGMWVVVKRDGLPPVGAGEGDLHNRCLGSWRGGDGLGSCLA